MSKKSRGKKVTGNIFLYIVFNYLASAFFCVFITWGVFEDDRTPAYIGSFFAFLFMILPTLITVYDAFTDFSEKLEKEAKDLKDNNHPKAEEKIKLFAKYFATAMAFFIPALITHSFYPNWEIAISVGMVSAFINFQGIEKKKKISTEKIAEISHEIEERKSKNSLLQGQALDDSHDLDLGYTITTTKTYYQSENHLGGATKQFMFVLLIMFLLTLAVEFFVLKGSITKLLSFDTISGTIISNENEGTTKRPHYQYSYKGKTYNDKASFSCGGGCYDVGEILPILVNPSDPNDTLLKTFLGLFLPATIVSVFLFAFGGVLLFMSIRFRKAKLNAVQKMLKIESLNRQGDHWFQLSALGRFEDLKMKCRLKVNIPGNVAQRLAPGKDIPVSIDKQSGQIRVDWKKF